MTEFPYPTTRITELAAAIVVSHVVSLALLLASVFRRWRKSRILLAGGVGIILGVILLIRFVSHDSLAVLCTRAALALLPLLFVQSVDLFRVSPRGASGIELGGWISVIIFSILLMGNEQEFWPFASAYPLTIGYLLILIVIAVAESLLVCVPWLRLKLRWDELAGEAVGPRRFSLTSLLGVGCLLWLLVPLVQSARESAHSAHCSDNLRGLTLSFHNSLERDGHLPPPQVHSDGQPPRSWRVELLSLFDEEQLRERYMDEREWDSPDDAPLISLRPLLFGCPSFPGELRQREGNRMAAFAMPTGPHTFGSAPQPFTFAHITDGLTTTIMLVEACGRNIVWLEPRDVEVTADNVGINLPGDKPGSSRGILSSWHPQLVHAGFADGHIQKLNQKMDPQVLRAMLTIDGGETIPDTR